MQNVIRNEIQNIQRSNVQHLSERRPQLCALVRPKPQVQVVNSRVANSSSNSSSVRRLISQPMERLFCDAQPQYNQQVPPTTPPTEPSPVPVREPGPNPDDIPPPEVPPIGPQKIPPPPPQIS
jgi:hypothetical protein